MSLAASLLHLRPDAPMQLDIDTGALVIRREGRAAQRIPLKRISLLLIEGQVTLDTLLIARLVAAGIGIVLLDAQGQPCSEIATYQHEGPGSIVELLDRLLCLPGWESAFAGWHERHLADLRARTLFTGRQMNQAASITTNAFLARTLFRDRPAHARCIANCERLLAIDARNLLRAMDWPAERLRRPRPGPDAAATVAAAMEIQGMDRLQRCIAAPTDHGRWYAGERAGIREAGRRTAVALWRFLADWTARARPA